MGEPSTVSPTTESHNDHLSAHSACPHRESGQQDFRDSVQDQGMGLRPWPLPLVLVTLMNILSRT